MLGYSNDVWLHSGCLDEDAIDHLRLHLSSQKWRIDWIDHTAVSSKSTSTTTRPQEQGPALPPPAWPKTPWPLVLSPRVPSRRHSTFSGGRKCSHSLCPAGSCASTGNDRNSVANELLDHQNPVWCLQRRFSLFHGKWESWKQKVQ